MFSFVSTLISQPAGVVDRIVDFPILVPRVNGSYLPLTDSLASLATVNL